MPCCQLLASLVLESKALAKSAAPSRASTHLCIVRRIPPLLGRNDHGNVRSPSSQKQKEKWGSTFPFNCTSVDSVLNTSGSRLRGPTFQPSPGSVLAWKPHWPLGQRTLAAGPPPLPSNLLFPKEVVLMDFVYLAGSCSRLLI